MAYQRWWKTVRDQQGNAINGATCTVYNGGLGTLATVYDPNSDDAAPSTMANPFITTATGVFGFMAADGEYDVQISGGSFATQQYRVFLNSAGATIYADLAAPTGAGLVGYQAPYAGAVARSQASKDAEYISVKDFGAVGDGITDDTTAIQAAVNSLPLNTANAPYYSPSTGRNGGALYFPGGSYLVSSPIIIDRGAMIIGDGVESTRIISKSLTGVFLYQLRDGGGYTPDAIGVRDLSIWQQAGFIPTSGAGVEVIPPPTAYRGISFNFSSLLVEGTYYGVKISNGMRGSIRDSTFTKTRSHGVYVYNPPVWKGATLYYVGLRVVNVGNIYEVITQGTSNASGGPSGTDADITDGTCHWKFIEVKPAVDVTTSLTINGVYCYLSVNGDGFHIETSEYTTINNCGSDSNSGYGYVLNGGNSVVFLACGSEQNRNGGLLLFYPYGTTVIGLRVVEGAASIGYTPGCTRNGLEILYATRTTVIGSTFTGTDTVNGYGIKITTTGPWVGLGNNFNGTYFTTNTETNALSLTPGSGAASKFVGGDSGKFGLGVDTPDASATLLVGGTYPIRLGASATGPIISAGGQAPTVGAWTQGSRVLNSSASVGQPKGWVCTASGTPGTWVSEGNL